MNLHLKKYLLGILVTCPGLLPAQDVSQLFNTGWKFKQEDVKGAEGQSFNDTQWRVLDLPHDWSVEAPLNPSLASATGYLPGGIGWYRKTFTPSEEDKGKKIYIYFDGVYNNSEVYVNGKLLGKRPNGYVSFYYDISNLLQYGQTNTLAVKVDHSKYNDSRWYTGSGIYRNVYLLKLNPVHIDIWGIGYGVKQMEKGNKATVSVSSKIVNSSDKATSIVVLQELYDLANNKIVAQQKKKINAAPNTDETVAMDLNISNAKLWSLSNPFLYSLKTSVISNGNVVDVQNTNVGIRQTIFDPNKGFALNGEWIKLKGVCIHHDAGVLGAAFYPEIWERRLKKLKEIGCNTIRLSHNPQAPQLYDLCDKLGFLIMDEAFDEWRKPKRKWVQGWNVGTPTYDGYAEYFDQWGEKDLQDMVARDKRHPSIILWSIGNEVDYPNDPYSHPILDSAKIGQKVFGGYLPDHPNAEELGVIAKKLVKVVKSVDTTRPVTAALAGVVMSNFTDYPGALDVAGYNYTEDRYELDHKTYPNRIIYGSENRHDMDAWKAVRDSKNIFGQFLWTGIDYLGESGTWPSRGFYSGLVDFAGYLKPRGYFRKALWSNEPSIYLGTYIAPKHGEHWLSMDAWSSWNYEKGQLIRVVCYTNTAKAQLFLNDKEVGQTKNYDDKTGIVYWDVPYEPGTLYVKGLNANNQVVSTYTVATTKQPAAISLKAYNTTIDSKQGAGQIEINILDEDGKIVDLADNQLTCSIDGPGQLLGLEAGDNTDMGDYRDNIQRVHKGRMIAYVKATNAGTIKVTFTSPWLKTASVNLVAQ
ncbi:MULTISPECIES: sugar-binding domain-containing protein [Chitinophagaceae]